MFLRDTIKSKIAYMSSVAVCFPGLLWIVRNTLVTKESDPLEKLLRIPRHFRDDPKKGHLPGRPLGRVT